MTLRRELLVRLLEETPFQPATSWWRSVELEVVLRHGLPPGRGLDLGCGDGKLMRILLDVSGARASLVGVDPDPAEAQDAKRCGVYERVHAASGERIPEPDASFDFVFSNSVLEHIEALEPVLAEVARLLRPRGRFLFTVPAAGFHDCLRGPLVPSASRARYLEEIDRRCAHLRYWGEPEWRAGLERHGMQLSRAIPYLSAAEVRRWETLSRLTAGVLYAAARKRRQPIEIQRALRLRHGGVRLPRRLAAPLAAAIAAGVPSDSSGRFGCLLVEGRRHD